MKKITDVEKALYILNNTAWLGAKNQDIVEDALYFVSKFVAQNNADGCAGCAFEEVNEWEMPCAQCKRNCKDYWRHKADE